MSASLTQKTASGLKWSTAERFTADGIQFVIQVLLARLVGPAEFGLIAVISIFLVFSRLLVNGGFGDAIIQKQEVSKADVSTAFLFNLFSAVSVYAALYFAAPRMSDFFNEPRLTRLVRTLSILLVIQSLGIIQSCLLRRRMEFSRLFWITVPAISLGGIVGVVMALSGWGVWSLVVSQLTTTSLSTLYYWMNADPEDWPRLEFSIASFKTMGRYGINILGATLLYEGVQNLYGLVIGKCFALNELAFYNRARTFHRTPSLALAGILNRVLLPAFSSIQDDRTRVLAALRKGVALVAFVVFPIMAWLMTSADHIVGFLLGDAWARSADLMRIFPIVGATYPLAALGVSVMRALGRSGLYFLMNLVGNLSALAVLLFTVRHGLMAIVIGQVCVSLGVYTLISAPAFRHAFGYRARDQLLDVAPYLGGVVLGSLASLLVDATVDVDSHLALLVLQTAALYAVYLAFCAAAGLSGYHELATRSVALRRRLFGPSKHAKR